VNSSNPDANGDAGVDASAAVMAALRSLARTWAGELRDRKIRVGVIAGILNSGPNAAENDQFSIVPLPRYATAEDVANAALVLAST
jgi:NAD(P)-dependent dehydrogenase (short-subunit alcohol dehydrogenase family)